MAPADIEALERATLAAVPPRAMREQDGWLLPLDEGTVGRAHSAVPLRHEAPRPGLLDAVERCYREAGLKPMIRLACVPCFDALRHELRVGGYSAFKPTWTQTARCADVAGAVPAAAVRIAGAIDDDWAGVFLGEGFDPVDGASRLAILRRARDAVFASVQLQGEVAAVGSACFAQGWCGIHGMRTAPAWRGRGLAASILGALAREAQSRGIARAFLQVDETNAPARSLYARAGFGAAWRYEYWA